MDRESFLKAVRKQGEMFRVDSVVISTGKAEIYGSGTMKILNNRFKFEIDLADSEIMPEVPKGIIGKSQFWTVRGNIENNIEFTFAHLPSSWTHHFASDVKLSLLFSTNSLDLIPSGWDKLTHAQIAEEFKESARVLGFSEEEESNARILPSSPVGPQSVSQPPDQSGVQVNFSAILRDFKLIAGNGETKFTEENPFLGETRHSAMDTFYGEFDNWEFGLIEKDDDLHLYLRSRTGSLFTTEQEDMEALRAFENALAFTHGQHVWPFSLEYRRNGKLIMDRIKLHDEVARTPHAPFNEAMWFNTKMGNISWDLIDPFQKAYSFFRRQTSLTREITELLYLFREAGSPGIPSRIQLLTLCALLEGLIRACYRELVEVTNTKQVEAFNAAKKRVCE